jgi:pimeloyl-ACP methyl ester carboxylesterase
MQPRKVKGQQGRRVRVHKTFAAIILAALSIVPLDGFAGSVTGTVTQIDVADFNNYSFRVYLANVPMCGNSTTWAYLPNTDSNYNAYAAALLTAYVQKGRAIEGHDGGPDEAENH